VPAALAFAFRRAPALYRQLRDTVLLTWLLALPIFTLFPVAPPRLADTEATDTLKLATDALGVDSHLATALYNPLAAVPSLHCGFAFAVGLTLYRLFRRRPRRRRPARNRRDDDPRTLDRRARRGARTCSSRTGPSRTPARPARPPLAPAMTSHTDRARQFLASALAVALLAARAGKLIDPDTVTDMLNRDGVLIPTTVLQLLGVVELLCAAAGGAASSGR
jgi:hypothetical protein